MTLSIEWTSLEVFSKKIPFVEDGKKEQKIQQPCGGYPQNNPYDSVKSF